MKLRWHLVGLAVLMALPVLVFSVLLIFRLSSQEHLAVERGLRETTRALALAVDREVATSVSALQALGATDALRRGDLREFAEEARRVLGSHAFWHSVLLLDGAGRPIFDTTHPLGAPEPSLGALPFFQEILRSGAPRVSDLLRLDALGEAVVVVAVPVHVDARLRYVEIAVIRPDAWGAMLKEQRVPPDVTAAILDRQLIIVARSRRPEEFVGQPATPDLAARARAVPEGWDRFGTKEGTATYAAFSRAPLSGWTVAIGTPAEPIDAALRRSLLLTAAVGLALLLVGGLLAARIGQRIAGPILAISRSAAALGREEALDWPRRSGVEEVETMGTALEEAARVLRERGRERNALLSEEQSARVEAQAALARLERLQGIVDVMLTHVGLDELLQQLLIRLRAALGVDTATVLLLDETGAQLRVRAAEGIGAQSGRALRVPISRGLAGRIAREARTLMFEDLAGEEIVREELRQSISSLIGMPLYADDRLIGVIHVGSVSPRRFTDEETQLLRLVADRLALAIHHAELDEAVRQARIAAEAAGRERDHFFAVVSHELRAPLSAIRSWAQVLAGTVPPGDVPGRAVEVIGRNAEMLARLSADLSAASGALAGRIDLHVQPLDLGRLLGEVVETIGPEAEAKGVILAVALEAEGLQVAGDPQRLQQIFANLLGNAIKFTEPGGTVSLTAARGDDGQYEIRVSDTGRGIDPTFLPRVFDRFAQGESGRHGGLGLGLAIVQHLVTLHGGTITAESRGEGRGATFSVRLPALPQEEAPSSAAGLPRDAIRRALQRAADTCSPAGTEVDVIEAGANWSEIVVTPPGMAARSLVVSRALVERAGLDPRILASLGALLRARLATPPGEA